MLMAKSRHKKTENVRRYFKPSPEAIAEVTNLLAPGNSRALNLAQPRPRVVVARVPAGYRSTTVTPRRSRSCTISSK